MSVTSGITRNLTLFSIHSVCNLLLLQASCFILYLAHDQVDYPLSILDILSSFNLPHMSTRLLCGKLSVLELLFTLSGFFYFIFSSHSGTHKTSVTWATVMIKFHCQLRWTLESGKRVFWVK